jgi:hypothetical protein
MQLRRISKLLYVANMTESRQLTFGNICSLFAVREVVYAVDTFSACMFTFNDTNVKLNVSCVWFVGDRYNFGFGNYYQMAF